ncbi:hypothetical protein Cgig2_032261 [Carnegiea gigantea]|uniref:Thioredoxin domain-containing protein n=1 Tax=Carnegiea gigantea TaxID=171969 RepID=A0A9Q1Q816_9CARY|nr:hypothetical protein Cgig2_032261 [Carnegiea gigantea]
MNEDGKIPYIPKFFTPVASEFGQGPDTYSMSYPGSVVPDTGDGCWSCYTKMRLGCPRLMGQCWTKLGCLRKKRYRRRHQLAGGRVQLVNKVESWEEKLAEAKQHGKTVVVKFSATWCTPCKEIAQPYRKLADKYSSLLFLAVDVDEMAVFKGVFNFWDYKVELYKELVCFTMQEFCTSWDIKATPTFYFFRDGQAIDKLVGANEFELQKKIAAVAEYRF